MKNDIENVIINQKRGDKLSHAYLIETNDYDLFEEKLKVILKILLCNEDDYCNNCQSCYYIDKNQHPNVVFLYPDGVNIKVSQIENLQKVFSTKSSYSKYNIYVIMGAEKLNSSSGNALLKFLEEPEDNIIGILLTKNKSLVLPTIISRCQLFKSETLMSDFSEETMKIADQIELCCRDNEEMVNYSKLVKLVDDKNIIKDAFSYILNKELNNGNNYQKILLLKEIIEKMRYNVNVDLLILNYIIRMSENI